MGGIMHIKNQDRYFQQEALYCYEAEQAMLLADISTDISDVINNLIDRREEFRVLWNTQHPDHQQEG